MLYPCLLINQCFSVAKKGAWQCEEKKPPLHVERCVVQQREEDGSEVGENGCSLCVVVGERFKDIPEKGSRGLAIGLCVRCKGALLDDSLEESWELSDTYGGEDDKEEGHELLACSGAVHKLKKGG